MTQPRPLAVVREADCIGCTKCIQACPVDAILGSAGKMHTVIASECIGCKLCLPPCPVDCIDLQFSAAGNHTPSSPSARQQKAVHIKKRYLARQKRLQNNTEQQYPDLTRQDDADAIKTYMQNAVTRIKMNKTRGKS